MPHENTKSGWLPSVLMAAQEVWVTEDSTSMIFEAITARARVGLLPLPTKRVEDRVVRSVEDAIAAGYAVRYADWLVTGRPTVLADPMHEAGRCADEIVKRWFVSIR
jgi:mitochondrial fission protein ELM1